MIKCIEDSARCRRIDPSVLEGNSILDKPVQKCDARTIFSYLFNLALMAFIVSSCSKEGPVSPEKTDGATSTSFTLTEDGVILSNGCLVNIDKSARFYSENGSCDGENYAFEFNLITRESNSAKLLGYTVTTGNQTLVYGNPDIMAYTSLSPDDRYIFPISVSILAESLPFPVALYYTLDNSDPSPSNSSAKIFAHPLTIEDDTNLLFRAVAQGGLTSSVKSAAYKFPISYSRSYTILAIPQSLAWDGSNLWYLSTNFFVKMDASASSIGKAEVPWSDTGGFTWDGDGFWISHSTGTATVRSKLSKVDQIGRVRTTFDYLSSALIDPIWDGQLVAGVSPSGWIQSFDATGAQVGSSIKVDSGEFTGLAWDGKRYWALDLTDSAINSLRYQPNSSTDDFVTIPLNGFREQVGITAPYVHTWHGLAVADGKLWISTPYGNQNLHEFEIQDISAGASK